ncbi:MAG: hypothetical protein ACXW2P_05565, partial [Thermoanaerobaculia bacterium]
MTAVTTMVCSGCGTAAPPDDPRPFRCPHAGSDDADHVLQRRIELDAASRMKVFHDHEPDPFIRYRKLTHAWHTAMANGVTDAEFI